MTLQSLSTNLSNVEQSDQNTTLAREMDLLGLRTTRGPGGGRIFKTATKSGLFGPGSALQPYDGPLARRTTLKGLLAFQSDNVKVTKSLVRSDGRLNPKAMHRPLRLYGDAFYRKAFNMSSDRPRAERLLLDPAQRTSPSGARVALPTHGRGHGLSASGRLLLLTGSLCS